MRRIIQLALFLSIFFFGFLALNYYIFVRMGTLLNMPLALVYALIIIFTLSYPIASILESTVSNLFTRIIYTIAAVWIGMAFYFLYPLIAYELLNLIFKIPAFTTGMAILIFASVVSAYGIINSISLHVKEIEIPIKHLKKELRIVQLSDTHIGPIRNSGFMKKIVEKTESLNPDLVLITGDLVEGTVGLHPSMFNSINKLKVPVLFITGNHDMYEGLENVFEVLKTTKIKIMNNEVIEFEGVQIIGVNYSYERNHLKKVLPQLEIDRSRPSILMYHVPTEIEAANEAGIDLQLSGHTHKGQMLPFNVLGRLIFPYFNGLHNYNGTLLYVSPGTGTWGPPMRSGSRNEITLINLKKK